MLFRKLMRELYQNAAQFLAIFLMSFLGICIFWGFEGEATGLEASAKAYYEAYALPDFWMSGKAFTTADCQLLMEVPGVEAVERRRTIAGNVKMEGDPNITLLYLEDNTISRLRVLEGEEFDVNSGGIWLDTLFAKAQKLTVGDVITIQVDGLETTEEIKGLITHPEFVYFLKDAGSMFPEYGQYAFGFLPASELLQRGEGNRISYTELMVRCNATIREQETANIEMKEILEDALSDKNIVVQNRTMQLGYNTLESEYEQHHTMAAMFSTIFLCIAIMGIVTTMTRMTANQRIQIGTMRALGFSRGRITWHYMSFGFLVTCLGSVLGAIVGYYWMANFLCNVMKDYYILPNIYAKISKLTIYSIFFQIVIATLAAYLACRKELRDKPADALKPKPPRIKTSGFLEKFSFWKNLSFAVQWNYRDIRRNKIRTCMGVCGVMGTALLLVCGFGLWDSMLNITESTFHDMITAKNKIVMENGICKDDTEEIAKRYAGQMIQEGSVELLHGNTRKSGSVTIVDAGNYEHFYNKKMQEITLPKEGVAVSNKMASQLGLQKGSILTFRIAGEQEWKQARVTQIYMSYTSQGIAMTSKSLEKMDITFTPTAVLTGMSVPKELANQDICVVSVSTIKEMKEQSNQSIEAMFVMIYMMVIVAALLGIVVLYNLGSLSYVEKVREIATLKVLGFSTAKIRRILQLQNIWVSVAGIMLGLPVGYGFLLSFCPTMSDSMDMIPKVSLQTYAIGIIGTFATSILVNWILSARVKKIDMVEALKGQE